MELQEGSHQAHDCKIEDESHYDADVLGEFWVVV
jgi:hypothetical protein